MTKLAIRTPVFSVLNPRVKYVHRLNGTVEVYRGTPHKKQVFQNPDLIKLGREMCKDYIANLEHARWHRVFTRVTETPGMFMVNIYGPSGFWEETKYIQT